MWSLTAAAVSCWKIETENCKASYSKRTFHLLHLSGSLSSASLFKFSLIFKNEHIVTQKQIAFEFETALFWDRLGYVKK